MALMPVTQAVYEMTKGVTMLKAGRVGRPHFRRFKLSRDLSYLEWESPRKGKEKCVVQISKMSKVVKGQKTKVFESCQIPQYECLSFSIMYKINDGSLKTLDIVCKSKTEFEAWTSGLQALLSGFSDKQAIEQLYEKEGYDQTDADIVEVKFGLLGQETVHFKEDACDIYTWGEGTKGMLGHGEDTEEVQPRVVEALLGKDVRKVACGATHTMAVSKDGEVFSWGSGYGGRLGQGHLRDRFTPIRIAGLKTMNVTEVACNEFHSAAICDNGEVYTWGKGGPRLGYECHSKETLPRRVPGLEAVKVTSMACGLKHTLVCTKQGAVFSFGDNEYGQLGIAKECNNIGPTKAGITTKCTDIGPTKADITAECTDITDIGPMKAEPSLVKCVSALAGQHITKVACGRYHSAALAEFGSLWLWGCNESGQLGNGNYTSTSLPTLLLLGTTHELRHEAICTVSCGAQHTTFITKKGRIFSCGDNSQGQLGIQTSGKQDGNTTFNVAVRVRVPTDSKPMHLSCGDYHTAIVTDGGEIFTWGQGKGGRLGHGDHQNRHLPTEIEIGMEGKHVRYVACGGGHTACTVTRAWVPDQEVKTCMACKTKFTAVRRRHHCRKCGGVFCGTCTSKRIPILALGYSVPVRACDKCHAILTKDA